MYNIIESKYRYIFLICIIGILLFLFINSGAVVEGFSFKKFTRNVSKSAKSATNSLSKAEDSTANIVKKEVNRQLPSLVSAAIAKPMSDIKDTQAKILDNLKQVTTKQANFKNRIDLVNANIKQRMQTNKVNFREIYKNLLSNLSQKYKMYKNGIANEGYITTSTINNMNKTVLDASEKAIAAEIKAQEYSKLTTQIRDEVFDKLSTIIIKKNNEKFVPPDVAQQAVVSEVVVNPVAPEPVVKPVVSEPVAQQVVAPEPVAQQVVAPEVVVKPVAPEVVVKPVAPESVVPESVAPEPVVKPVATEPVATESVAPQVSGIQAFTSMSGTGYINRDANNKNLFDLEKDLVNAINDFNTSYYNFIRCSSGGSINCGNNVNEDVVNTKSQEVIRAATALKSAYKTANIQTNDGQFNSNHQEILVKSKSIDELRRNLDKKMETVIKSKNPPNELTQQYDSTVYTGIMWSVLATSVLFYVFTEM
jgi:hypothetical protein